MTRTLAAHELSVTFDASTLDFSDTSELVDEACGWIGQPRAERAVQFGLAMEQADYHLFVLGETGSGRSSLVYRAMQQAAALRPAAPDLVYLHNFERPERPLALRFKAGQGTLLRTVCERFCLNIAHEIPRKLDEEGVRLDSAKLKKSYRRQIDEAYAALAQSAAEHRFALHREDGRLLFTLLDEGGQAMQEDALLAMPTAQRIAVEEAEQELRSGIESYLEAVRPLEREMEQALAQLRRQTVEAVVVREIDTIRHALQGQALDEASFERYLQQLGEDVLSALDVFSPNHDEDAATAMAAQLARYRVNLLVDNRDAAGAPALRDDDPDFRSLFGGIDYQAENGVLVTDFMHIRAGNLLRAHGGTLMLQLRDVMRDATVWEKLQRLLRNGRLQIEEPTAAMGTLATTTLEPEALQVQVKLVLIGSREDYYELQELDAEFARRFRVKVDFADDFAATEEARRAVAVFIAQCCAARELPHFNAGAVTRLLLDMQREIDDQRRISARFGHMEGVLLEAASIAGARRAATVTADDVEAAVRARRQRHDYPEQDLLDAIADGEVMISAHGVAVGQINGLTQIDLGDYRFGSPVRITARAWAGDGGISNIDREVEMTGPTHDKGMLILEGWLSASFHRQAPLDLAASLVFEQEYHGVDGDSASCAELYALLSALSGLPLAQGLAVTGALNQHGEVMPIGGVNEKIEGWFRTCQRLGLDGKQGAIIPARNHAHLLLDQEVRDAVARGEFRVHVIDHVLQGMELLTGVPAGEADELGVYPADSIMGRVQVMLESFHKSCEDSGHLREHEHGNK
jgi:predicted ATP-dependent protease